MDNITKVAAPVEKIFHKNIAPLLNNPVGFVIISWITSIAVMRSFDKLPSILQNVLLNPFVHIIAVFSNLFYATNDLRLSLLVTIIIVILFKIVTSFKENFELNPVSTDIMVGCENVTMDDILVNYKGDVSALKKRMYAIGVPLNLALNNQNAPLIATHLVGHGEIVKGVCQPPM